MTPAPIRWGVFAVLWLIAAAGFAMVSAQVPTASVEARIPFAPTPVVGSDGLQHLGYELHITNFYKSTGTLRLERLEVFGERAPTPVLSYRGDDIERWMVHPGTGSDVADRGSIPGGMRAVVYLWITLKTGEGVPASLRHRLVFVTDKGVEQVLDGARLHLRKVQPMVLGSPLRGGIWLAHEGPGNHKSHHWGSQLAMNGRVTVPQRFAIDLIGLDTNGNAVRGDFRTSANENWVGFGTEVLAVADGVVREMLDGVVDNKPLATLEPSAVVTSVLYGNHVVLEVGANTFVTYAHLRQNSVTVKTGERVRRGQALGRVGNSGNTNAAHLHFQVSDAPTFQDAEGLPFVFDSFDVLGKGTAEGVIGAELQPHPPLLSPVPRRRELPLDGAVVRFR